MKRYVRMSLTLCGLVGLWSCATAGRGRAPALTDREWARIWSVYVEPVQQGVHSDLATRLVVQTLAGSRRFILVPLASEAHAVVRVTVSMPQPPASTVDDGPAFRLRGGVQPSGTIMLISADSATRVLWSGGYAATRIRSTMVPDTPQSMLQRVVPALARELVKAAGPVP